MEHALGIVRSMGSDRISDGWVWRYRRVYVDSPLDFLLVRASLMFLGRVLVY